MGKDLLTGKPIQPSRRFSGTRAAAEKALVEFRTECADKDNQTSLAMTASCTVTTRDTDQRMADGVATLLDGALPT